MPIFDQGYQHWQGELGGNLGAGGQLRGKACASASRIAICATVLYLAWMPAFALGDDALHLGNGRTQFRLHQVSAEHAGKNARSAKSLNAPRTIASKSGRSATTIFLLIEMYYAMLLILMVGPNLISQDLRFNALPLYFSRPLRRIDYFIGKLGVIMALFGMIVIVPSIIAYIARTAVQLGYFRSSRTRYRSAIGKRRSTASLFPSPAACSSWRSRRCREILAMSRCFGLRSC